MFLDTLNPHKANWDLHTEAFDSDSAQKVEAAIQSLEPESKQIVERIESKTKTTQNWYGDYLAALQTLVPDNHPVMLYITASALKRAGANEPGLVSALNIIMRR